MRSAGAFKTKSIIPDSTSWTEGKEFIKSNQGQGVFTSDATSGDYTEIYLAD